MLNRRSLGLLAFVQPGFGEPDPGVTAELERIVSESPNVLSCRNATGDPTRLQRSPC